MISGTAAAPITFESIGRSAALGSVGLPKRGGTMTVQGASYVDLVGIEATIDVKDSSHVSLTSSIGTVAVGSGSSSVSIERNDLNVVTVGPCASGTVVAANLIWSGGVSVDDAVGTDVVNNDIWSQVAPSTPTHAVAVADGSTGTSVENNLVFGDWGDQPELLVDAASAAGTTEGYNLLSLNGGTNSTPYSWAGADYSAVAAFQGASGQGAADLAETTFDSNTDDAVLSAQDDPALGSANASAPGLPSTDYYGNV